MILRGNGKPTPAIFLLVSGRSPDIKPSSSEDAVQRQLTVRKVRDKVGVQPQNREWRPEQKKGLRTACEGQQDASAVVQPPKPKPAGISVSITPNGSRLFRIHVWLLPMRRLYSAQAETKLLKASSVP